MKKSCPKSMNRPILPKEEKKYYEENRCVKKRRNSIKNNNNHNNKKPKTKWINRIENLYIVWMNEHAAEIESTKTKTRRKKTRKK